MPAKSYSDIVKAGGRAHRPQAQGSQPLLPPAPDRPPLLSAFPPLVPPALAALRPAQLWPARSMSAVLQGKKKTPPAPLSIGVGYGDDSKNDTAVTATTATKMDLPGKKIVEGFQVSPEPPKGAFSAHTAHSSSAPASASASVPSKGKAKAKAVEEPQASNAALWFTPIDYDIIIWCRGLHWKVHRSVLVEMSEWMEKYMPPAKNGETVSWALNSWDPGVLGAILEYMYLEDYQGGDYNPDEPLDTSPILKSVAAFLAATSALVYPMMDHALERIDAAAAAIENLTPILDHARLDTFELFLRRALLVVYGEPDQWRVRALRVALGRLAARAFPFVLRSPRWADVYQPLWGILRVRVVVDHKWLVAVGVCEPSDTILVGFEHMDIMWVKYRGEDWRPADDLMFPEREAASLPDPPSSPPRPAADQKKKSKAIPIVRPDGTMADIPRMEAASGTRAGETSRPTDTVEPATTWSSRDGGKGKAPEHSSLYLDPTMGTVGTPSAAEGSFTDTPVRPVPRAAPDPHAPRGSAAWWAYVSLQPYPSLFPTPLYIRPQSSPFAGGPYFAAETSTGEPSEPPPSEADSALGRSYVEETCFTTARPASSVDALLSPTRHLAQPSDPANERPSTAPPVVKYAEDRFRDQHVHFGGSGGCLELTQKAIPRLTSHRKSQSTGHVTPSGALLAQSDNQATPRRPAHELRRAVVIQFDPADGAPDEASISSGAALRCVDSGDGEETKTPGFLPLL